MTTKYSDFVPANLTFTEWNDGDKMKVKGNQRMAFHRYNDGETLRLQLPWMKIFKHGIPDIGEFYATDKDRSFLKMPIDVSDTESRVLYDKLIEFDKLMNTESFKTKYFGKKSKKFTYIPVVKNTEELDEERPPWMKLKIWLGYPDEDIRTQVLHSELKENKKRTRTEIKIDTVGDFKDNVSYRSNVRLMIQPSKLWAQSENLKDPTYGIAWKMLAVEVDPQTLQTGLSQSNDNNAFLDSDASDNEEVDAISVAAEPDPMSDKSDDESDDSDEESEDESPPSPLLKKKSKSKTKNT